MSDTQQTPRSDDQLSTAPVAQRDEAPADVLPVVRMLANPRRTRRA